MRVPKNALGAVFLLTATLWSLALVFNEYAKYALITAPGTVPGGPMAMWLAAWIWIPGTALLLFAMPMLFPDGHLPSARWRPVAAVVVVGVVMSMLGHALVVWPLRDTLVPLGKNFMAADQAGLGGTLASIGDSIMFLVAPPIAIASLVMRYRRSTGVAREQLRWLTFTIVVTSTVTVASQVVNLVVPASPANAVAGIAVGLVPIALTAAILRYHLYDIDRIISRTLAYAVVTSLLAAVFIASNLVLQAVISGATGQNTIAVAGSTLLVATLFQPIRRRVQAPLDRRFDRGYVDGARVVERVRGPGARRGGPRPPQRRRRLGGRRGRGPRQRVGLAPGGTVTAGTGSIAQVRNDVRTLIREDAPDDCNHSPLPTPRRQAVAGRAARRRSGDRGRPRPSSPAWPWTSPRPIPCSRTSSPRPVRSTSPAWSSSRRRSRSCGAAGSPWWCPS